MKREYHKRDSTSFLRSIKESPTAVAIRKSSSDLIAKLGIALGLSSGGKAKAEELSAHMDYLGVVCNKLSKAHNVAEEFHFIADSIREILSVDGCVIRQRSGEHLKLLYSSGIDSSGLEQLLPIRIGLANVIVHNKKIMVISDIEKDEWVQCVNLRTNKSNSFEQIKTYCGVPMIVHDEVVGVIGVFTNHREKCFSRSELNMLQILANSIGMLIKRDQVGVLFAQSGVEVQIKIMEILEEDELLRRKERESTDVRLFRSQQHQLEYDLRQDSLNLTIHYQPICKSAVGVAVGYEALVRWNHPEYGLLYPNQFIYLAESTGLISLLGNQVYRLVAKEFHLLFESLNEESFVSINISILELHHSDFASNLYRTFHEYGVKPSQIVLELTERMLLEQDSSAIRTIKELQLLGFRLFLDDFGTGHNSLTYLLDFEVDGIKIDKSFMPMNHWDSKRLEIFCNLVLLAKSLKMELIAEGVETEEQIIICSQYGVTMLQGYGIGYPTALAKTPITQRECN
ncbi:MAG: EAL domain-containing protein [Candidatus Sumerlaeia bacterium]|nr:EAL domain-containing protein [Candidatus Sumerlaeia bacterium]